MINQTQGFFITLEGGEGSGKTTLIHQLSHFLKEQGYCVVLTREPGGSRLGETIRGWLLRDQELKIGAEAELLLFLAARAQHIEETIAPALKEGKIVLCDRFNDSTIAYQGGARGLGVKYVQKLCQSVCKSFSPRLTLFLNVSPEIGLARAKAAHKEDAAAGEWDRIESEKLAFHRKIQKTLVILAKKEPLRIHSIDANQSQRFVFQEAVSIIQKLILPPARELS